MIFIDAKRHADGVPRAQPGDSLAIDILLRKIGSQANLPP